MRIDKFLAHTGFGSRQTVRQIIKNKQVYFNNQLVTKDDIKIEPDSDIITVNGLIVTYSKYVYIMLNKPAGYITANKDHMHKVTKSLISAYDHFDTFAVGRLDIDTEGLLLITNDGPLSHELLSPKKHVDKTYYVEFSGQFQNAFIADFKNGVVLDDGYLTMPAHLVLLGDQSANLTIQEGKFHQVKRMFKSVGLRVTYLKRITFGSLHLDDQLKIGEYRLLNEQEMHLLKNHKGGMK